MKVAVVEDDTDFQKKMQGYLARFSEENSVPVTCIVFSNGRELTDSFTTDIDLVLMDIEMPEKDGLTAARDLRSRGFDVPLMFITNVARYAVDGYEVDAADYVLKPVNYYSLALKLSRVFGRIKKSDRKIVIRNGAAVWMVFPSDIYYVEVFGHTLCYHTADGDRSVTGQTALREVEERLKPYGFARCSQFYLINMRHVQQIQEHTVTVSGKELQISGPRRKAFLTALLEYCR